MRQEQDTSKKPNPLWLLGFIPPFYFIGMLVAAIYTFVVVPIILLMVSMLDLLVGGGTSMTWEEYWSKAKRMILLWPWVLYKEPRG